MLLTRVSGPTSSLISTASAKAFLRVDQDIEDDEITAFVTAATRAVGEMAGRVLVSETWALSFANGFSGKLCLPKSPVQSVSSITYYDADDAEQTSNVSDFYLTKDDDRGYLTPKAEASWPAANQSRDDAITVTFVAGYTECPENLRSAALLMVGHLYENRMAVSPDTMREIPLGVQSLVGLERLGWVGA